MKKKMDVTPTQKKIYEKIIEDATVDCHDDDEQISGWECVLDEKIAIPHSCRIGK